MAGISSRTDIGHATLVAVALGWTLGCVGVGTPAGPSMPALRAHVRYGPGLHVLPRKVLALSAVCRSVESDCPDEYSAIVDNIVRMSTAFAGYALIVPEDLQLETAQRTYIVHRSTCGRARAPTQVRETVWLHGARLEDLSVEQRRTVLEQAGIDSVLSVRIVVGPRGFVKAKPDQVVEVSVKLGVERGRTLAWASRCHTSLLTHGSVEAALEYASRCAIHGVVAPPDRCGAVVIDPG